MKNFILGFFCFAIPAYLLLGLFGLAPYLQMLGPAQLAIKLILLGGFVFVLVSFWRLESVTTDDKLFWTIGTLLAVPIGLPLLYFKLSNETQQTDSNQSLHSDG